MRKAFAVLLYLFALAVFAWSAAEVFDALYGVPAGLTGGRTRVTLPGDASLEVRGAFVRSIDGTNLTVRSLSPSPVLTFLSRAQEAASFSVNLVNVKPLALRGAWFPADAPLSPQQPVDFKPADPGVIRFTVLLPPGESRTYAFEQLPSIDRAPAEAITTASMPLHSPPSSDAATTSGAAPSAPSVRFFVFGGVRDGLRTFERLLRIANEESPDFLAGVGDTYYRANVADILRIDESLSRSSVPVYLIPGEIEYRSPDKPDRDTPHQLGDFYTLDRHAAIFGPGNNEFTFGGWRFVFLDNSRKRNRASLRWLGNLPPGDPAAPRTILLSHIPPFDPRKRKFKGDMTTGVPHEHERIVDALGELSAAAAFFGHYHGYAEGQAAGVPCYVTSAAGTKLPRGHVAHFLDITLYADGTVGVHRRPLETLPRRPNGKSEPRAPLKSSPDDTDTTPGMTPAAAPQAHP